MKVLHVNFADIRGGAARAAYRLHLGLLDQSIQSQLLVTRKKSKDNTVIGPKNLLNKTLLRIASRLETVLTRFKGGKTRSLFSPGLVAGPKIRTQLASLDADVIILHWTCQAMLRIEDLQHVSKPIIWTLHDLWPLTGGCHTDKGCEQYHAECGNCPVLSNRSQFDLSHRVLSRKQASYAGLDITIVTPSQWMADNAREKILGFGEITKSLDRMYTASKLTSQCEDIAQNIKQFCENGELVPHMAEINMQLRDRVAEGNLLL